MSGCCNYLTDAAFAHLAGIHTLNMIGCSQATISDAAFSHLAGIHTLIMGGCNQPMIVAACRTRLAGPGGVAALHV